MGHKFKLATSNFFSSLKNHSNSGVSFKKYAIFVGSR